MYEMCRVIRAFNPNFADAHVDAAFVDSMAAIKPLSRMNMLGNLKAELPQYLAAAKGAPIFNKTSVEDFSEALLLWCARAHARRRRRHRTAAATPPTVVLAAAQVAVVQE